MSIAPFQSRHQKLIQGKEIVEVHYFDHWLRGLEYESDRKNETANQEDYKREIAHDCGYPEDEWWRIIDIEPAMIDLTDKYGDFWPSWDRRNGIKLIVTFLNPGKCIEEGMEVTVEEWETFKTTRDKSRSGSSNIISVELSELPEIYPSSLEPEASASIAENPELSNEK